MSGQAGDGLHTLDGELGAICADIVMVVVTALIAEGSNAGSMVRAKRVHLHNLSRAPVRASRRSAFSSCVRGLRQNESQSSSVIWGGR